MEFKIKFLSSAERDLKEALDWYYEINPKLSANLLNELNFFLDHLKRNPYSYRERYKGLRVQNLEVFPYQVVYKLENSIIKVVSINHSKRDPGSWKKRL
jgi:plasmid stabilization system protein ParE